MSKKTKIACDWCGNSEDKVQNKVGEDWGGYIYHCGKCSHEYVVPGETEMGNRFYDWLEEMIGKKDEN